MIVAGRISAPRSFDTNKGKIAKAGLALANPAVNEDAVTWVDVIAWGPGERYDAIMALEKGTAICVEGEYKLDTWYKEKPRHNITARTLEVITINRTEPRKAAAKHAPAQETIEEEDVPW